ncbi:MAG: tetratricopeptide repeat protein [Pleurocapsa sp.]
MSVNWEEIIWAGIEKLELTHSCQSEKLKQSAQDYYQQGKAFKNSGDIASAIVNFTQAIELAPDNVNAYFGRGASYSYLGKYQNSIDDFSRLVEFHPTAANYYNRGVIYYLMKKYKKAIANFTQAISLKPNFVASYLSIANAYYELDNCKLAHNNYKNAKNINYNLYSHDEIGLFAQ